MEGIKSFFLQRSNHIRWLALVLILICGIIWFTVPAFEFGPYYGSGRTVTIREFIGLAGNKDVFSTEYSLFEVLYSETPVYKVGLFVIIGLAICAILVLFKLNTIAWFLSLAIELSMAYLLLKIFESDMLYLVKGFWEILGLNVLTILALGNYSHIGRSSSGRA